jgi:type IV secretion system protein TrbL
VKKYKLFCYVAIALLLVSQPAAAQFIINDFKVAATTWETQIKAAAFALFWILVGIDFCWTGITLALRQVDIGEVVAEVINRVMIIGFYLALLTFSTNWGGTIIESLTTLATNASGAPAPSIGGVMSSAISICGDIFGAMSLWDPGTSVLLAIMCVGILILFALMAAEIAVAVISVWILLYAGIIMLAFGGARWTQDYAISYYKAILAASVKLFVIQMILAIGMTVITAITALPSGPSGLNIVDAFKIMAAALILYVLIGRIGELTQALMSGNVMAYSNAMQVAAAATAAAAMATTGGATAINSASKLASAQSEATGEDSKLGKTAGAIGAAIGGAGGQAAGVALGNAVSHVAGTIGNLAKAGKDDFMGKVHGEAGSTMGTKGGRMASRMDDAAADLLSTSTQADDSQKNYIFGVQEELDNNNSGNSAADQVQSAPTPDPTPEPTPDPNKPNQ